MRLKLGFPERRTDEAQMPLERLSVSLPKILLASLGLWSMGRIKLRDKGRVLKELGPEGNNRKLFN